MSLIWQDPESRERPKPEPSAPLLEREWGVAGSNPAVEPSGEAYLSGRGPQAGDVSSSLTLSTNGKSHAEFNQAHARSSDPETSHAVAAKITNLGPVRDTIVNVLYTFGPMTDEQIAEKIRKYHPSLKTSGPSMRSRRSELVKEYGMVCDSGSKGKTEMGNPAIIWRLK